MRHSQALSFVPSVISFVPPASAPGSAWSDSVRTFTKSLQHPHSRYNRERAAGLNHKEHQEGTKDTKILPFVNSFVSFVVKKHKPPRTRRESPLGQVFFTSTLPQRQLTKTIVTPFFLDYNHDKFLYEFMTKSIHLTLPIEIYEMLKQEAEEKKKPLTKVVREFLEEWSKKQIREKRRKRVQKEFSTFAKKYAGTDWDVDPDLEAAGIESFLKWEHDHA